MRAGLPPVVSGLVCTTEALYVSSCHFSVSRETEWWFSASKRVSLENNVHKISKWLVFKPSSLLHINWTVTEKGSFPFSLLSGLSTVSTFPLLSYDWLCHPCVCADTCQCSVRSKQSMKKQPHHHKHTYICRHSCNL